MRKCVTILTEAGNLKFDSRETADTVVKTYRKASGRSADRLRLIDSEDVDLDLHDDERIEHLLEFGDLRSLHRLRIAVGRTYIILFGAPPSAKKTDNLQMFGGNSPSHCELSKGLNLEYKCSKCHEVVFVQHGFSVDEKSWEYLSELTACNECPNPNIECKKTLQIKDFCRLWMNCCRYTYVGAYEVTNEHETKHIREEESEEVENPEYIESKGGIDTKWLFLKLKVYGL